MNTLSVARDGVEGTDALSRTFAALGDPTRRALLARLAQGEASVSELAAPFDLSLAAISKHLKVLQHAGLVSQSRQAQWRPCRLELEPLQQAASWLGSYSQLWEDSFDRLDALLQSEAAQVEPAPPGLVCPPKGKKHVRKP